MARQAVVVIICFWFAIIAFGDAGDVRPDTPSKRKRGVADDAQGPCDSNCESASAISE